MVILLNWFEGRARGFVVGEGGVVFARGLVMVMVEGSRVIGHALSNVVLHCVCSVSITEKLGNGDDMMIE